MSIKINFDTAHNPEEPTFVLAKRNGDKLGLINAKAIEVTDAMNDAAEVSFNVYKFIDGKEDYLWSEIKNFRLVHCVEWDRWFEITVEVDESDEDGIVKTVFGTQLGNAELSQINLYNIQINTEDDIARDEYDADNPTVLYRPDLPSSSLLHRLMEKAPHYSVRHVDSTIANIQRTFEFDGDSIDDAFQDIAEEIHCLFVYHSDSDENGKPSREFSVYDLESNCLDCGYRSEFNDVCPECGGINTTYYGNDTTIFVTADELAEDIQWSVDTEEVKNCFKLEAGDDLMTASIRNCNPNGSDYLWYISDATKEDMSDKLVARIKEYDDQYTYYQNNYVALSGNNSILTSYNALVDKYKIYKNDLQKVDLPIKGYPTLMNAYYNTIDLELYLESGLMPTITIDKATAKKEAAKLTAANLSPVAVESERTFKIMSQATANSVVLSMAKVVADSTRFRITVHDGATFTEGETSHTWTGCFDLEAYGSYDEDDDDVEEGTYSWTSNVISVTINDDYEAFVKQKIDKALSEDDTEDVGIVALFSLEKSDNDFAEELAKYSLNRLTSFHDAAQACIDILIEQGIADQDTWSDGDPNLYDDLYLVYRDKLLAIEAEMKVREDEISLISGVIDEDGNVTTKGLQNYIEDSVSVIQDALDFEEYLGEELWLEFCCFRREDKYSNDNYISDGLDNAQIFEKSLEFIEVAENEIYKSAELQHSISASLKNFLAIKKFEPLVDQFEVGNWLRVMVDDEVYKLRLIEYSIDYDSLDSTSVEFSDSVKAKSSVSDIQDVLDQASSMSSSYSSVQRQAKQGESSNERLIDWANNGLALTNMNIISDADNQNVVWNSNGLLCREYNQATGDYDAEQLKIINKGLYVTDDSWTTSKAGIGKFTFFNPKTQQTEESYGVIADTLVGSLMLSEEVGVYTKNGNIQLDENGLTIVTSEGYQDVFLIKKEDGTEIMYVDPNGNLVLKGGVILGGSEASGGSDISVDGITSVVAAMQDSISDLGDDVAALEEDSHTHSNKSLLDKYTQTETNLADAVAKKHTHGNKSVLDGITAAKILAWDNASGNSSDALDQITNLAAVATTGNYNDLVDTPDLAAVATSGSYNDLSNKPTLATVATTGSYSDLSNKPSYNDLSEKPDLAEVATSGSYNDLLDTPTLAEVAVSGSYDDLSNTPSLSTVATSGSYADLTATSSDAGKLIYIDDSGKVTSITISELKTLLDI